MKTIPILLSSILLFCFTINTPLVASIIPYIGYSYIGYSGNQISGSSGAQINVYVGQAFTITVNGANNGATTAVGGGIDLELWDVTTQNGNQISLTSNASNQEYWVGSKLGTGQTSQYLLLESGFSNWSGGAYKALQVNFQILKPGTYRLFTKMYLTDGSGNFPRDPSSTGPYKDQQEQGCYLIGTIIAQNPPPSVSKVTISLSPTTVNLGQYSTGTGSLNGTGSSTVNYIWEYQKPGQSNWNQYDTSSTTMTNGIGSLFSIPFTPPFDTPGIYVFRARTTSPNQIISNTKSITVPEPPKPDLTVTSVILDKNSVQAGWPVNVTYTLKNSGPAASTGVSKTGFYLSTTQYGAQTYLNETPDASINLVNGTLTKTSGVIIPANTTSGDYYLTVFADYINMVDEGINEGNNILGTAISVFKFEVKGITLNATTPTTIDLGGYVTTSGTITGVGSGTVSVQYEYQKPNSSTWLTYDSPSNITMTNNSATLYNETFTPQFDTPGIYLVRARTTSPNQVTSAPLSITIRTPPKPNLTISTISFNTPSVQAGEAVNFTYTLKNLGPAASTGVSWTGFYLSTTPYGTQIFLGETPESSIATVNGTNTKTNGVIIPANTLPGTYYLSAYADYKNQIDEGTNEDDNIKSAQLNVIKFEVTGVNISVTPSSLNEDELMTKSATFSGTGSGTVYYRWEDKIPGSSTWNPIKDNSVLMTDGSATLSAFQIPAYAPLGTHYHRIVVTSPNALTSAEVGQDVNSSLISTSIYAPSDIGNGITPLDFHGKPGTLVRFGAILVKKDILSQIIELDSKQIKWEIQLPNSGWTPIDEDGISTTNQLTSFDGIIGIPSENYYVIPDDLTTGDYNIRAYFIGDNQYSGCSRTGILTVDPIVNEITLVNPNINSGNGIPVILVHGNGNDKSEQPNSRWDQLIAFINDPNNTELFKDFDIYNWQHVTEIPIGFNGTTGNAKHLANFINTFTSQGKKVILVAHSQGGLICRSYMNYGTQGENVLGLITLATPHHGSPLAVPDWAALVWRDLYNNSTESSVAFNLLYDRNQTIKKLCQVDYDRIGDLNLAWDNLDLALNTGLIYADFPGISFAVDGKIQPSARDMNQVSSFSDKTLLYSDKLKSQFGTLAKLNQEEIQKGQNLKKIIAYGAYDDDLSDNPKGVANTVGEIVKNGFEFEHNGLSFSTYVMSEAGKQSLHLDGLSVFYANDGMVPLQSALFLDISGGTVFSGVNGSNGVWYNSNIESKKQVKLQRIFSGTADGIKDHLDLLDTKSETYWKILANDIRSFLPVSDQVPPTLTKNTVSGTWFNTNKLFDIDFSDNTALNNVWYQIDDNNTDQTKWHNLTSDGTTVLPGSQNNTGTSLTTDWKISNTDWNNLTSDSQNEGRHYLYFKVTDDAGNEYITPDNTAAFEFRKDVINPIVNFVSPQDGQLFTVDNVDVSWSANDVFGGLLLSGVDKIYYAIDQNSSFTAVDPSVLSHSFTGLSNGKHFIYLKAKDIAGNESSLQTLNFSVHVPAVLEFTSGDNQHGLVGTPLSQPFTATVKDAGGYPVQGITVNFAIQSVPSGALGQSLTRTNGVTDAAGKIKSLLTLGEIPGDYLVTVTAAGISDSYLIFTATATVSDTKILAVNPDGSSDFGSVNLNASTDRTIVLQNNGSAALNISHIAISGSDAAMFSIISPSGTAFDIPAGESVPVSVRFIPTGGGGKSASLDLTSNSDNATSKSITLNGNGVLPNAVITVSTGQLRNGTADGTPVLASGISGRGKAASFDGSWRIVVDNSTPADFALKGNWTMAYSVFPQNDVRWGNGFIQRIGDEGECNKRGIYMFLDTPDGLKNLTAFDKTYFGGNENATKLSLDALQLGQWNRIIIVHRSDQTADIYINGVKTYSNISLSIDDAGTKKISIGGNYLNDGCYAADFANSVMLDDFVLLKDALTETQVTPDNLTSPVGFNDPQLPSYFKYDFEETLIADKSSQTVMTLGNLPVGSNSVPQSFQVSGTNLTDDVTLSAPDGFQLSAASDGSYGGSLLLSPSGGNVSSTVYVRFSPALVQTYSGNISIASSGVTTVNVSLTGAGVPVLPTLTTKGISSITASTVMGGGEISSDGGEALSAKGVCWGADSNPTVSLSTKTSDGTGIGTFVSLISGLNPSTTYHVRAYASNSAGTSYGDDVTFTTAAHDNMPQLYMDNFVNLDSLILYGSPLPVHVPSFAGRTDLFDNSGDEGFNSGAITKNSWDLSKGFVLESEVYLDFSNPEGCWNSAAIGLANPSYQSWGGYDAFVIFSYTAVGAQCLATDATRRHAILHGGYLSTSGWESFGDGSPIIADAYLNNWQRLKIVMGSDRIPQFYIGGTLLYAGQNPVADQVFAEKNRIWLGDRSSGNAGKAYHDWVKLSGFITPKVVTSMLSNITNSTATGGGNINADHDFNLSARGVCWSTSENPTADLSSKTTDGTGNGVFISAISGLTPGTTYHIRAYATNADGTYYGDDISFITAIDNPDNTLQDDNVLNTIMSGLKIVEKIKPGNMTLSVDQNKMLTDNYNSCVKIGDYIVYTKTAQSLDPVDRSFESGTAFTGDMLPENLLIKFAWKSDGTVYIGAMGTDDEVLAAIVDGTGGSIGCYSGQRTFFEGYAISTELKNMQTASLVAGIPSPDSLNTVDFFRKMSSKIFNRFSKPIFRIFSAVAFQGSPYPVLNPEFALWCPFPGLTTGTATRSFNLSYTNNLNSYVTAVANNDNANSSYIKLDGDIVAQMHKWIENFYRRTAVYPLSVEIGASTIWAHSAPRFSIATVCDNVLYSDVNQNPAGGLSNNRPPMISGIPVYQSDFTPTLSVNKGNISLGFSIGSTETFNISSNTNWEVSVDGDWISISQSKGTGDKAITIVASAANPASSDRNITITVNAPGTDPKTITVTQKGAVPAITDVEGNVYPILKIGDQWWMGKDLKTGHYNNGEQIANITVNSDWSTQVAGAYCWYNNDETANKNTFGALYNYYSVADNRNLCPTNWHVPSIDEWTTLTNSLGGASVAGDALKEAGTNHWWDGNAGTNSSGFTAVPGGSRYYDDGVFYWQGGHSRWWSSTLVDTNNAWINQIQHNEGKIDQTSVPDQLGVSVRCVKDVSPLDNGLIAYYPFNGNAIDESGNNHNGTVNNAQLTTDRFGNSNKAYRFNGTTDYINLAGTFGGNTELTISAWVYVEQPTSDFYAIVSSNAWGSFCHFQLTGSAGGGIGIYTSPAYFDAPGLNVTPTGRWRHTVLTVKNGETRVYEDNVIQSQSGQTVANFTSTSNLMIGSGFQNGRFFNGKIDDVRIFNRAISESEVDALFKEGGYSGYGSYLVFNSYQEGHSDVYSCNPDGSNRKQLTSNSVEDYNPKISPDGNKIAFTSDESGQYEVYTMNRDGSGRAKVTSTGTYGGANGAGYVRWFDNDYLLYTLNTSIRKVKRDGSENTEIITSANGNPIHNFDYCKLTGKIVYQAQGGWAYINNFYLVNLDGTGAQLVVGDRQGLEHYPVFSPDGTKIVYMFDVSGHEEGTGRTLNDHLFMHEIAGGAETDLSAEKPDGYNDVELAFASDGSGMIYSSIVNDSSQPSSLFTYSTSGSHRSLLISDAFSPDVWPKVDNFTPTQNVSKTNLILPYTAGTSTTFNINSNTGWQIATDASWLTVSATCGFGDKVITVSSKSTNPGLNDHVGTITVSASGTTSNLVTVTQKGSGLTVIDNEGNIYPIVKIGDQWWMAENLKTTHYNNGDQIPNVTDNAEWAAQTGGAYCWYGNDAAANKETYGALYNWYTVNDGRQIAPKGWHVATDDEWTTLTNYLVSTGVVPCGALKETGFTHWSNPNEGATNSSGFGALPGGYRFDYGGFLDVNIYGHWWSNTASDTDKAWYYYIFYTGVGVARNDLNKKLGFSVRCVKDVSTLDSGLIASYPFNGNAQDQSGNELDLIPNTNPIAAVDRFNNLTGAYSFNGTSDYFIHPTDPLLLPANELSLCAWFYSTGIDGVQDVLISTLGNSAQNGYQLNLDQSTNTIGVLLRNPDGNYVTVTTPLDISYLNAWTSVVFTYSNIDGCKLYVNNVLKTQVNTPFQIEYGADQNFRIGANFPDEGADRMFKGKIDDVRVYSRALTESEVDVLYHEGGWPLSGNDKYLVFNSYQTGNSYVYSCKPDGSNRTQLTSNSCQDYNPKISPDGTKIAFTSDESGQYDVYLMNRDGSGRVKVTSTGTYGGANGAGYVRWLDNDRLLYTLGTTIRKVNTDGSANSVIVTSANGNPIHDFDYSSVTGKIVYQAQGGWAYVNDFYLVNLDGSGAELLIGNRAGLEHYPVFNTDGTKIFYTYDLSGHEEVTGRSLDDHLFMHQLTDHSETDLSSEKPDGYVDLESAFIADGSRIVFSSKLNDESQPSSLYTESSTGVGRSLLISDAFSPDIWPRFGNITPLLSVDKTDISLPSSAGTEATFNVSSNTSWDISSSAPWLNISPAIGFGNKEITVSSKVTNSGTNDQTATITISSSGTASKIVTVTQTGTGLTITDFDNNNYSTVQIGNQLWMGENLKTKHYNTGAEIPNVTDNSEWAALTSGAYCWYGNDEASNKNPYGGMYNWHAVNTGNLCPVNWHVPTDAEWTTLTDYLGAVSAAGDALKEAGTTHWWGGNAGTNSSGFAAVGAGNRYYENGDFYWQGGACRYWSSNAEDSANAWALELNYSNSSPIRLPLLLNQGVSVRCLQNSGTPDNTITLSSGQGTNTQSVCINTAITPITYATTGATGADFTDLPTGVTGLWESNVVTISGTPNASDGSPFNYTVTLTGGSGSVSAHGTITVNPIPTISVTTPATCSQDLLTWSVEVTVSSGTVSTTAGTVTNTSGNNWSVSAVALGINITLTVTDVNSCQNVLDITAPDCNCPVINAPVSGGDKQYCSGESVPQISASVGSGETVDWYTAQSGGSLLLSGSLTYTPDAAGTFYAASRNTTSGCLSTTRTAVIVTMNSLPTITITTLSSCSPDLLTWSVGVTVSSGTVTSTAGTVTNTSGNIWSITGIPAATNITLSVTNSNNCVNTLSATAPDCSCPVISAPVSGGNKQYCTGESVPQINASVGNGLSVDWYAVQSGGSALLAGSLTYTPVTAGTYYAEARNTITGCTSTTRTPVIVTMNSLPTQFAVTGGGTYCSGQPGVAVGLGGSQAGVNYQLQLAGANTGSPVSGTGSAISFGIQSSVGTYTVTGTNPTTTCSSNMTGNAVVSVIPDCSTHFVTVWTGNGQDHMNINIVQAQTGAVDLEAGDEIGAFDGNLCVGMIKLTQTIHQAQPATFGIVKASRADQGVPNGFTAGDAIVFKIWDTSTQQEKTANHVDFLNPANGQVISPVPYAAGGSTFVKLSWLNTPPVANAGPDQIVSEGDLVSLDGSGSSDGDNDPLTYQWVQTEGSTVTLGYSNTSAPTFTAPSVTQNTDFGFALTVNDGTENSVADNVTVTVRPIPKHFLPVWSGNGQDHMNFNVYSVKLDGTDLELGDEIGLYDGFKCVGAGILQGTLSNSNLLAMVASADDGSGNGYTPGHSITYRVYDKSADKEVQGVTATYSTSNPSWSSDGKYAVSATTFVGLDARTTEIQQVLLNAGWNIFSLRVMPGNVNMSSICQPLIDATKLNKVMDESGKAFEDWGVFGGWQNNIGNLQNTEGYKINVSSTVTLSVEGLPVQLPLDIPMSTGWNIISWPSANEQDGKTVMQTLIDAGKVTKVMDQAGRAIEDWGVFGGWQNNIGNLKPGEGYKVNVSGNCTLTVNQFGTKSTEIIPDLLASSYYKPVYSGYGDDHMNINLVDIVQSGLQVGDQIGIFDGKYCVGAVTIGADQLKAGTVSIPASSNDGLSKVVNGFTAGHQVELELFRESQTFKLEQLILKGNNTFEKNGSLFVNVTSKELNVKKSSADSDQFKCYPNPFNDEVTIYILNPQDTEITVGIYNLLGQQIKTLFKGQNKGELILKWDGTNDSGQLVSKGVYLCRMNGRFIKLVYNGDN